MIEFIIQAYSVAVVISVALAIVIGLTAVFMLVGSLMRTD